MQVKIKIIFILLFFSLCIQVFGQEITYESGNGTVPLKMVFHNIGWNTLHSLTHNYGLNFIGAGLGTMIFIESGLDWEWNRLAYNHEWMPKAGEFGNIVGYVVPVITPVFFYFSGLTVKDEKMQIAGLALTQSLGLTMLYQLSLKLITGRTMPGIMDGWDSSLSKRDDRTDDFSGEFNWFSTNIIGGWPSGHVANAFSAAATIAQIYHDKTWLKVTVYSYASLVGVLMSVYDHWASEVFAGALIGLAIGTTVGRSYRNLLEEKESNVSFYVTPNSVGVIIRIRDYA